MEKKAYLGEPLCYVDNAMNRRLGRVGQIRGYYVDNPSNRRQGRVGLPYGTYPIINHPTVPHQAAAGNIHDHTKPQNTEPKQCSCLIAAMNHSAQDLKSGDAYQLPLRQSTPVLTHPSKVEMVGKIESLDKATPSCVSNTPVCIHLAPPSPTSACLSVEKFKKFKFKKGSPSAVNLNQALSYPRDSTEYLPESIKHPERTTATRSASNSTSVLTAPLADLVRPTTIEEFVGQEDVIGKNAFLRTVFETGDVPSLIFWGPPGCGKTTLAKLIAGAARKKMGSKFVQLSATTSGVADVKEAVKVASNHKSLLKKKTLLFIDEIHRFNKLQQDSFLPHVENGTITLLGATTENPSFQLNSALLSRCRVVILEKLKSSDIVSVLKRAMGRLNADVVKEITASTDKSKVWIKPDALDFLANLSDGDARIALNGLQLTVQIKKTQAGEEKSSSSTLENKQSSHSRADSTPEAKLCTVTLQDIKSCLQKTHLLYDRAGDEHYHIISALHKSMRGSDANAALYWLARMLCAGEDPLYIARRVIRFASEDVGLADPNAMQQAVAAFNACQYIGMPECEVNLAQAVVYMARAPKSVEVYKAYSNAKSCVLEHEGPLPSVPLPLRNAPTTLMKKLEFGAGYKYNPDYDEPVEQEYLPEELKSVNFFANT